MSPLEARPTATSDEVWKRLNLRDARTPRRRPYALSNILEQLSETMSRAEPCCSIWMSHDLLWRALADQSLRALYMLRVLDFHQGTRRLVHDSSH